MALLVRVGSGPEAGRVVVVPALDQDLESRPDLDPRDGLDVRGGRIVGLLDPRTPLTRGDLRRLEARADGDRDLVVGLRPAASSLGSDHVGDVRRLLCGILLGVSVDPARIACVMTSDESAAEAIPHSFGRGSTGSTDWTGWAELVGRAHLRGLRVRTVTLAPALADPATSDGATRHTRTVARRTRVVARHSRVGPLETFRGLARLRPAMGLSYLHRSPVYWSLRMYSLAQRLLGEEPSRVLAPVADLIPSGASVTDLCCGPADLYSHYLRGKECVYVGMDFNAHFVSRLQRRGVDARFIELPGGHIAPADYIVMCASLYHFRQCEERLLDRMLAAARSAVIISEPVRNLSSHRSSVLGRLANRLTNPGIGSYEFRHDRDTFRRFAERHGASELIMRSENPHAIAVFRA